MTQNQRDDSAAADTPVSAQISRELEILRAAHKEVESLSEA